MADIITLDIGGTIKKTTLATLRNRPNTMLSNMFAEGNESMLIKQADGSIFIDEEIDIFKHILEMYRRPDMDPNIIPSGINKNSWYAALDYWCIPYDSQIEETGIIDPVDIKNEIVQKFVQTLNKLPNYLDCLKSNKEFRHIILPESYVLETTIGQLDMMDWFLDTSESDCIINDLFKKYNMFINVVITNIHSVGCRKISCSYCPLRKFIEKEIPLEILTELEIKKKPLIYLIIKFI